MIHYQVRDAEESLQTLISVARDNELELDRLRRVLRGLKSEASVMDVNDTAGTWSTQKVGKARKGIIRKLLAVNV